MSTDCLLNFDNVIRAPEKIHSMIPQDSYTLIFCLKNMKKMVLEINGLTQNMDMMTPVFTFDSSAKYKLSIIAQ